MLALVIGFVVEEWQLFAKAFVALKALKLAGSLVRWGKAAIKLSKGLELVARGKRAFVAIALATELATTNVDGTRTAAGKLIGTAGGVLKWAAAIGAAGAEIVDLTLKLQELDPRQFARGVKVSERPEIKAALKAKEEGGDVGAALIETRRKTVTEDLRKSQFLGIRQLATQLEPEALRKPRTLAGLTDGAVGSTQRANNGGAPPPVTGESAAIAGQIAAQIDKSISKLAERPIEVRMDSDVVARANERAPANRRRPPP
jgi:hypothetical protein